MPFLKASVQYNDWTGTCAADNAGDRAMLCFLTERGLINDTECLVGIELWIGENHAGKVEQPYVTAFVIEGHKDHDDVTKLIGETNPIPMKRIDVEISLNEFLSLFKRFDLVLSWSTLKLTGREYTVAEV